MGQKVSPVGFRIGIVRDWQSRWYAEKEYGDLLQEDIKIRELIFDECRVKKAKHNKDDAEKTKTESRRSGDYKISRIEIERSKSSVDIIIRTAAPGLFLGKDEKDNTKLDDLKNKLKKVTNKDIKFKVIEVGNPDLDARLVALKIVKMLEERQSFRTAQKKAIQQTMRAGAKGIKTAVSGRLGGADIARSEGYSEGIVPLHTIRSDIDFAWEEAMTTYGKLGVKVWICRGEVLPGEMVQEPEKPKNVTNQKRRPNRKSNAQPKQSAPKQEAPVVAEEKSNEEEVVVKEDE